MEEAPRFTTEMDKGKGLVFEYNDNSKDVRARSIQSAPNKLMAASFKAHSSLSRRSVPEALLLCGAEDSAETTASYSPNSPTVFKASNFAPCSSGIVNKRNSARKRPPKSVRRANQQGNKSTQLVPFEEKRDGKMVVGSKKKKCSPEEKEVATTSKDVCLKVVPNGGLPSPQ